MNTWKQYRERAYRKLRADHPSEAARTCAMVADGKRHLWWSGVLAMAERGETFTTRFLRTLQPSQQVAIRQAGGSLPVSFVYG